METTKHIVTRYTIYSYIDNRSTVFAKHKNKLYFIGNGLEAISVFYLKALDIVEGSTSLKPMPMSSYAKSRLAGNCTGFAAIQEINGLAVNLS